MAGKINEAFDLVSGVVKFGVDQFSSVSKTARDMVENGNWSDGAEQLKKGLKDNAKKIVSKTSGKGSKIIKDHKDILPEKIRPVAETAELILESVSELTVVDNNDSCVYDMTPDGENVDVCSCCESDCAAAGKKKSAKKKDSAAKSAAAPVSKAARKPRKSRAKDAASASADKDKDTATAEN